MLQILCYEQSLHFIFKFTDGPQLVCIISFFPIVSVEAYFQITLL